MKIRIALCAAGLLAGMGVARADGLDPIAVRQTAMGLTGGAFGLLRAVVAAQQMGEAATRVAAAAKAGDAETVAAETKVLGEQCSGCHKAYRAK
jgi:cytochrome c556